MFTQDLVAEHTNHKSSAHKRHTNDSYNTTIEIFNPSFGMAMERQIFIIGEEKWEEIILNVAYWNDKNLDEKLNILACK